MHVSGENLIGARGNENIGAYGSVLRTFRLVPSNRLSRNRFLQPLPFHYIFS